jgi:hypothetical protein
MGPCDPALFVSPAWLGSGLIESGDDDEIVVLGKLRTPA